MSKKVLNIGQCAFDHSSISNLLSGLGAKTIKVDLHAQTRAAILEHSPSLILVNRLNDNDGASGLDLIKELRSDPAFAGIPIMLVSNYTDAQKDAVNAGAINGFGKSSIRSEETRRRLKEVLGS